MATSTPPLNVRKAQHEDARRIARIHRDSWRAAYAGILRRADLDRLTLGRLTPRWRASLRGVAVVEIDGRVEGFVSIGPTRDPDRVGFAGEVFMLYVHPGAWGRGGGRALLAAAEATLARRGHRWLQIWVLAENTPAQAFYRRLGLRRDGATRLDTHMLGNPRLLRYAKGLGGPALMPAA